MRKEERMFNYVNIHLNKQVKGENETQKKER
jgi:hypothetical protein